MRALLALLVVVGCDGVVPDLDGDLPCGSNTCHSGQICLDESAGQTCWTNDAGIGEYDTVSETCVDVPGSCNGVPSCACLPCEGLCFGVQDRVESCGCF